MNMMFRALEVRPSAELLGRYWGSEDKPGPHRDFINDVIENLSTDDGNWNNINSYE